MIVPMRRYVFLVHRDDYEDFLLGVRKLGVLHVRAQDGEPSEELLGGLELQREIRDAMRALRHRAGPRSPDPVLTAEDGLEIVRRFHGERIELEELRQQLDALRKEEELMLPWGEYDVTRLHQLRLAGVRVRFFSCPARDFPPAGSEACTIEVVRAGHPDVHFVVLTTNEDPRELEAEEWPTPTTSRSRLAEERTRVEGRIESLEARFDRYAASGLDAVESALRETESAHQLAAVVHNTRKEADGSVAVLEGFVPEDRRDEVEGFCRANDVAFLSARPTPRDVPPVLLRNSPFARLFEPIGRLFALPSYGELDLTPFFAPFFMMFFGFCLGDAGYGLVLVAGATVWKPRAPDTHRPILTLVQLLGGATIVFGGLTGTFFGINLLETEWAVLESARALMMDSDRVFRLALALGLVQILFGLTLRAYGRARQFGGVHALSSAGWIVLILSLLDAGLLGWAPPVSTATAWVGAGLILVFHDPEERLLPRLGKGLWELYGITGIFGDLLSYIRLFALGISSAILGFVVNDIGLQLRDAGGLLGPVLFVLFLVVGHGLNLLIASLGAFVHPMRLTFVEFYKNAGFAGGGKPYNPLSAHENHA